MKTIPSAKLLAVLLIVTTSLTLVHAQKVSNVKSTTFYKPTSALPGVNLTQQLVQAVQRNDAEQVKSLLRQGVNTNTVINPQGDTILHAAIRLFVAKAKDPQTFNSQAFGKILYALLAAGANPATVNKQGKKPADYAADYTIVKQMLTNASAIRERSLASGRRIATGQVR